MASKRNDEVPLLKSRVKELEGQVADYKKRLDDLRKAKNTTVLKREREILEVGGPNLGQRRPVDNESLHKLQREMSELKLKHDDEIKNIEAKVPKVTSCDHEELIRKLKQRISDLENDNSALVIENADFKEKVDSLFFELSMKEAQWCETEEQLNLKLKTQWSEKYRGWMAETEKKIEDLQAANNLMRTLLKKQKDDKETS